MFNRFHWTIRKWFGDVCCVYFDPQTKLQWTEHLEVTFCSQSSMYWQGHKVKFQPPSVCHFRPDLPPLGPVLVCRVNSIESGVFGLHTLNFTRLLQDSTSVDMTTHHHSRPMKKNTIMLECFHFFQSSPQNKNSQCNPNLWSVLLEFHANPLFFLAIWCAWTLSKLVASPPSLTCHILQ